ncbi:MAG: hypothetical protein AAFV74_09210 [Pseudomonadota bacterium]
MTTALITMAYQDTFFLPLWIRYYAQFVSKKQIYVLIHGRDEALETIAEGCNVINITRPEITPNFEKNRWLMLSHFASGLTYQYDTVMYLDTDEIVFSDPTVCDNPLEFIDKIDAPVISPHGFEVMHRGDLEPDPITNEKPILEQREYARINTAYSKPCIIRTPVRWCSGGHAATHPKLHLAQDLFQFHLRFVDEDMYMEKMRGRREATSDPKTGEHVAGVGGANWNVTDERAAGMIRKIRTWPITQTDRLSGLRPFRMFQKKFGEKQRNNYHFGPYYIQKRLIQIPDHIRTAF